MQKSIVKYLIIPVMVLTSAKSVAVETSLKGIFDIRAYQVTSDSNADSYLAGDYGKFRFGEGSGIALGQLGAHLELEWENNISATIVGNAFAGDNDEAIGITEAYFSYKNLPNSAGWRLSSKLGLFYPKVSLENVATAWSTPYSLTSSSLNNWLGEEFRSTGINFTAEKLGRFSGSDHSFSIDMSMFLNNDPAGAMITWHGWTVGSRQTLLQEKLILQDFPARTTKLAAQASRSDPFLELDDKFGVHIATNWKYKNSFTLNIGYYDNRAEEGVVEDGQYTWTTDFIHVGIKYKPVKNWELISQFMSGRTNMFSPYGEVVVDNNYDNVFVLVRHFWDEHHIALRAEHFNVEDLDSTWGDNNNESGNAFSLAYRYKLGRQHFILAEYNMIDSERPSRVYVGQPEDLKEQQLQLGYRYYFKY